MARIRSIKPEMWDHEQLSRASILARLTFVGLISMADDEGRGRSDPEWLWGQLHAGQHPNVKRTWPGCLSELSRLRDDDGPLVVFYKVAGASYYWLPGFCRQQYIEKPSPSKLPAPPNSGKSPRTVGDRSVLERKGEERKGEDQGSRRGEEGPPPPSFAAPRTPETTDEPPTAPLDQASREQDEEARVLETVATYGAWTHPPADKKAEGIRELRALGLSHEYIRNGAQVNKPADAGFWDIVKALKSAHGKRSNGRARIPDARHRENATAYLPPTGPTFQEREAQRQKLADAAAKCDEALNSLPQPELADWQMQADLEAEQAKIPRGPMRETFIRAKLRTRIAKLKGIDGASSEGKA